MDRDPPALESISDTARWAAVHRARETERPDALFRDPHARRLAGERGEQIARAMPHSERQAWAWTTRTVLFDELIQARCRDGADLVVNLAAGLDARPYRMALPAALQWVEVDLPALLDYKRALLANERPACAVRSLALDLEDRAARRTLFEALGREAKRALLVTEGLLIYWTREQVAALADDLAAQPGFTHWALELASPGLVRMLQKNLGKRLGEGGAALRFGPEEGPGFFAPHGWRVLEVRSFLKTAARLRRLPFGFRLLAMLPESQGKQGGRPWSGVCLLGKP